MQCMQLPGYHLQQLKNTMNIVKLRNKIRLCKCVTYRNWHSGKFMLMWTICLILKCKNNKIGKFQPMRQIWLSIKHFWPPQWKLIFYCWILLHEGLFQVSSVPEILFILCTDNSKWPAAGARPSLGWTLNSWIIRGWATELEDIL